MASSCALAPLRSPALTASRRAAMSSRNCARCAFSPLRDSARSPAALKRRNGASIASGVSAACKAAKLSCSCEARAPLSAGAGAARPPRLLVSCHSCTLATGCEVSVLVCPLTVRSVMTVVVVVTLDGGCGWARSTALPSASAGVPRIISVKTSDFFMVHLI